MYTNTPHNSNHATITQNKILNCNHHYKNVNAKQQHSHYLVGKASKKYNMLQINLKNNESQRNYCAFVRRVLEADAKPVLHENENNMLRFTSN